MNTIRKISVIQFRNYTSSSFDFVAPITCITGRNGSGKTNLLDAVYYLCYTKSYFSSYQQNSVQHGCEGFRLEGIFNHDDRRVETISCKWRSGKKEIAANGVEYTKPTDHIGRYASVMIAPDDMELINDGGEVRRKWIDGTLGQVDKQYLNSLMVYQRILQQRNAWLKLYANGDFSNSAELDYYNEQLASHGSYIFRQRQEFIRNFVPIVQRFYKDLSGGREHVDIGYRSDLHRLSLELLLKENLQHDLRLQRTLRGIHKDDLIFSFDGAELKLFGSQGQKKSYLFALKLAQYAYLRERTGRLPILLLDDIFEKLDQQRMEALLRIIRTPGFGQVLLTDTHALRVKEAFGADAPIGFIEL